MKYLDRPATVGDVISWIIAVPAFTAALIIMPLIYVGILPQIFTMYHQIKGTPPALSTFVYHNVWLLSIAIPIISLAVIICSMIFIKNNMIKVALVSICNIIIWLDIAVVFLATMYIRMQWNYVAFQ
jgi:hypothetical protein